VPTPSSSSDRDARRGDARREGKRGRGGRGGRRGHHLWEPEPASAAAPPCRGSSGKPCTLAVDGSGQPGAATSRIDQCVFCSASRFQKLLQRRGGSLVTSSLRRLRPADRAKALQCIETHGGKAMRRDFKHRVARSQRRGDPSRPRRGVRGQYKRKGRRASAWGLAGCEDAKNAKQTDRTKSSKKQGRQRKEEKCEEK